MLIVWCIIIINYYWHIRCDRISCDTPLSQSVSKIPSTVLFGCPNVRILYKHTKSFHPSATCRSPISYLLTYLLYLCRICIYSICITCWRKCIKLQYIHVCMNLYTTDFQTLTERSWSVRWHGISIYLTSWCRASKLEHLPIQDVVIEENRQLGGRYLAAASITLSWHRCHTQCLGDLHWTDTNKGHHHWCSFDH